MKCLFLDPFGFLKALFENRRTPNCRSKKASQIGEIPRYTLEIEDVLENHQNMWYCSVLKWIDLGGEDLTNHMEDMELLASLVQDADATLASPMVLGVADGV